MSPTERLSTSEEDLPQDPSRRLFIAALGAAGIALLDPNLYAATPPTSRKNPTVVSTPEKKLEKGFTLGKYIFQFDREFKDTEVAKARTILERAHPVVSHYIPIHPSARGIVYVRLKRGTISAFEVDRDHPNSFTLFLPVDPTINAVSFDSLAHEYGHMLKGSADLGEGFIEEGITTAVSQLTAEVVDVPDSKSKLQVQLSPTTQKNIGVDPRVILSPGHPLSDLRYKFIAEFWIDLEKAYPGTIKKFIEQCYLIMEKGKSMSALSGKEIIALLRTINPKVAERAQSHSILHYQDIQKTGIVIYAYFHKYDTQPGELVISLQNRQSDSLEEAVLGKRIVVSITSSTGKSALFDYVTGSMLRPDEKPSFRQCTTGLPEKALREQFGPGKEIKVTMNCENIVEEFTFTIPN